MGSTDQASDREVRKSRAATLLSRFFAPPNRFVLPAQASSGSDSIVVPEELLGAIERFRAGHHDRPLLLPVLGPGEVCVTWLACSHDERAHRTLEAEIGAFVVPSYAVPNVTDAAATVARETLSLMSLHASQLRSSAAAYNATVARLWGTYWRLLNLQPPRPTIEVRTFVQLRAAFDRALLARNERAALEAMGALRELHGLTAENRVFLEIRLAAAFGRWDEILTHRQLLQVLQLRLPPETYGDLWEALYEVRLRPLEVRGEVQPLLDAFEHEVRILAAPLLRARGISRRPAALKAFVLHELSQAQPSEALVAELLGQLAPDAFGSASPSVIERVRSLRPKSGLAAAQEEVSLERYEQAHALLWPLADSAQVLTLLMCCVREMEDPQCAFETITRLDGSAFSAEVRQARPKLVAVVQALAGRRVTVDTAAGATARVGDECVPEDVVAWWRELARSERNQLEGRPDLIDRLVDEIEAGALEGGGRFETLMPIWFEWLVDRTAPSSRFVGVYRAFIEALVVRDQLGDSELEMMRRAAEHLLRAGPTPNDYVALVERLIDVFRQVRSPRALNWALDTADVLAMAACRDEPIRARWFALTLDAAQEYRERLQAPQRALLRLLAQEAEIDLKGRFDESPPGATVTSEPARPVRILIYSLDPQANQRAALTLRSLLSGSRVETNEDEDCTSRLHAHARAADVVAFVSAVATHQAFYCIKGALKSGGELVQVQGTGTTRIVQAVVEQVQKQA